MKRFVYQLVRFLTIPIILGHIFIWYYEKPQRESLHLGTNVKLQKWSSIQNYPNKYDVVILGSSRGYSAYNPHVIDSITRLNSYNMCTGSQHIIESLYMFKEILKHQKPKYLVYEVFLPSFRTDPDFSHVFSNSKYMSNDMVMNEFLGDRLLDIVFPIIKYKSYLKKDVQRLGKFKNTRKENSPKWISGYKPSNQKNDSISINNFSPIFSFSNTDVISKEEIEKYILNLKELCDTYGVKLLCVRAPYPPSRLKISAKDNAHIYFKELFNYQSIPFYDLNYNSTKIYSDYDFEDYHHLNSIGAEKVSIDLTEILDAQIRNTLNN